MQIHTGSHLSLPYLWPFDLRISACQGPAVNCWLGNRKGILPVKTEWWGAGTVFCLEQGADLHMFQLMSLPLTVSCFSKILISFTFLVPAHPGNPGTGPLNTCVWLVTFLPVIHKLFYLSGEFCIFEGKSVRQIGHMKQSTFLASNFAKCSPSLKILSSADWLINV